MLFNLFSQVQTGKRVAFTMICYWVWVLVNDSTLGNSTWTAHTASRAARSFSPVSIERPMASNRSAAAASAA